jgi:hypothetical protein
MLARPLRSAPFGRRKPSVRRMGVSAGSSGLAFPDGMTDARYTGMTELDSTLNLVAGTTYDKRSWLEHSTTSWSALMASNTTCNDWRMRTREGLRYRGFSNTAFNWLYLEIFGAGPEDHADGMQWENDDNGTNGVTFKNCHFRGTSGGFTCVFVSDGSTGSLVFEDCLFSNDGTDTHSGIIIHADQGFGTVTLSLKNCYFQETGWSVGEMQLDAVGTNPADVVLWDNVRYCSWNHTTKVLTPGALISQPANT